jgi:hypothetical protein
MILTAIHIKWVNPIYKLFYIKIKIKIKETQISQTQNKPKFLSLPLTNFACSHPLLLATPSSRSKQCEFSSSPPPRDILPNSIFLDLCYIWNCSLSSFFFPIRFFLDLCYFFNFFFVFIRFRSTNSTIFWL